MAKTGNIDAVYVQFRDKISAGEVHRTRLVYRSEKKGSDVKYVMIDFDVNNDILGVEILGSRSIRRNGRPL